MHLGPKGCHGRGDCVHRNTVTAKTEQVLQVPVRLQGLLPRLGGGRHIRALRRCHIMLARRRGRPARAFTPNRSIRSAGPFVIDQGVNESESRSTVAM